jgi:hypothetical protein
MPYQFRPGRALWIVSHHVVYLAVLVAAQSGNAWLLSAPLLAG